MTEREQKQIRAIETRFEHPELISWRESGFTNIVIAATINYYIIAYLKVRSDDGYHIYKIHKREAHERIPKDILNNIESLFGCEVLLAD